MTAVLVVAWLELIGTVDFWEDSMTADVLPIGIPSRAELWCRLQLARAVLNHRPTDPSTPGLVLRILDGVSLETLVREAV